MKRAFVKIVPSKTNSRLKENALGICQKAEKQPFPKVLSNKRTPRLLGGSK